MYNVDGTYQPLFVEGTSDWILAQEIKDTIDEISNLEKTLEEIKIVLDVSPYIGTAKKNIDLAIQKFTSIYDIKNFIKSKSSLSSFCLCLFDAQFEGQVQYHHQLCFKANEIIINEQSENKIQDSTVQQRKPTELEFKSSNYPKVFIIVDEKIIINEAFKNKIQNLTETQINELKELMNFLEESERYLSLYVENQNPKSTGRYFKNLEEFKEVTHEIELKLNDVLDVTNSFL